MTTMEGKRVVIFDLDGTLAPSKQPMTRSMSEAVFNLIQNIKVVVISGGGFPQFKTQFIGSLPNNVSNYSNLLLMPTSGTKLYVWEGDWVKKYSEDIDEISRKNITEALIASMKEARIERPEHIYGELIEDRGSQITFSGLGQEAPLELKAKWDPDHKKRQLIISFMHSKIHGFDMRIGGTTSIDITRRGINKAYGIHKLEQYLHVPIREMVFVGDALFYGGNDYPAKATGIDCIQVSGPDETEKIIRSWFA